MAGIARGNRDDPAKAPAIVVFADQPRCGRGAGGLANDSDISRVAAEGFTVFLHPLEPHLAVINSSVGVRFVAWKLHKTLQAHAVTQLDLDNAVARIRRALGTREIGRASCRERV